MLAKKNDPLIAAKAVLARYGGICGMTLHRWVRDPDLNFPKRLLINGRRYWRLSELPGHPRPRCLQSTYTQEK